MHENKIAYIFPGQGAQYVGMGKDLYNEFASAKHIFEQANQILGFDLKSICFNGPQQTLTKSAFCQSAILTHSIAAYEVLKSEFAAFNLVPFGCAGLSLGEYSALVAVGSLKFEDALKLVYKRGTFMDEASKENPGTMSCVLGLDLKKTKKIAQEAGVEIANLNCPGQIILSGANDNIIKANELSQAAGAKRVIPLDVSGPFHSSLMNSAADKLKPVLEEIQLSKPLACFIPNVTAEPLDNESRIKELLKIQVSHTTYWQKSINFLADKGVTTYLELGPGKVLRGLLQRINRELKVINLGEVADFKKLKEELEGLTV